MSKITSVKSSSVIKNIIMTCSLLIIGLNLRSTVYGGAAYTYSNAKKETLKTQVFFHNKKVKITGNGDAAYYNNTQADTSWVSSVSMKLSGDYKGSVTYQPHIHFKGWTKSYSDGEIADGVDYFNYEYGWIEALTCNLSGDVGNYYYLDYKGYVSPVSEDYMIKSARVLNGISDDIYIGQMNAGKAYWNKWVTPGERWNIDSDKYVTRWNGYNWVGTTGYALPLQGLQVNIKKYPCTVKVDPNGGTWNGTNKVTTINGEADGQITMSSTPSRAGYTFSGWELSYENYPTDGSQLKGTGGQHPISNVAPKFVNGDNNVISLGNAKTVTVKAKWSLWKHTVKYDVNGGSGSYSNQTKTYGKAITVSSTVPTKTGYDFSGWLCSADNKTYKSGASYTHEQNGGTVTLKAQFTPHEYSITYNGNGGFLADGTTAYSEKVKYNSQYLVKGNPFTKDGYMFAGWTTSQNGSTPSTTWIPDKNVTWKTGKNVTLYAIWKEIKWSACETKVSGEISFGGDPNNESYIANLSDVCNAVKNEFSLSEISVNFWDDINGRSDSLKFTEYGDMNLYLYVNVEGGTFDTITYDIDINGNIVTETHALSGNNDSYTYVIPSDIELDKEYKVDITIKNSATGVSSKQTLYFEVDSFNLDDIRSRIRTQ